MFDTNLVVVGNVLVAPEWRRIASSGSLVANFRIASTARRFDRETNRWVDGNNLRVRVTAWRRLAEGVASSIAVGDPVIVYGRFYTRDWKDDEGNNRSSYEMEAFAIGHDLARGRAKFFRNKNAQLTGMADDVDGDSLAGGELSVPLTAEEAPIGYGDGVPARLPDEEEPTFADVSVGAGAPAGQVAAAEVPPAEVSGGEESDAEGRAADAPAPDGASGAEEEDEFTLEVERLTAAQPATTRRSRRGPKREPIPA